MVDVTLAWNSVEVSGLVSAPGVVRLTCFSHQECFLLEAISGPKGGAPACPLARLLAGWLAVDAFASVFCPGTGLGLQLSQFILAALT